MDFYVSETPSLVKWNGKYYPTYKIDIDGDCIASELDLELDGDDVKWLVGDCEDKISEAISDIITKAAYERYGRRAKKKTNRYVSAKIAHCTWLKDYLFEGERDWIDDCSVVLDEIEFDRLPKPEDVEQAASDGDFDCIYEKGVKYGICEQWSGPYNVYIDSWSYEKYYEARKAIEG